MNETNLKNTMDQINIPEDMQKKLIKNLCRQTIEENYQYKYKKKYRVKMLLSAAAILLVIGVVSIPVQAGIRYLVKQRMESIPREEMESTLTMLSSQTVNVDSFSRDYSIQEKERMAELFKSYQNGTFPEGQLLLLETDMEIPENVLCYEKSTGCFYLPDRSLTDEELLQIIDFNYKRDYSLTLDPQVQSEIAIQEKEQEEIKAQIEKQQNSISEAEAASIAQKWIDSLFGISTEGMEETIYLDKDSFDIPTYHVTYDIQSNCYYYFSISTIDGTVMSFQRNVASLLDSPPVTESQARLQITETYRTAREILKEQAGIYEDFSNVFCHYIAEDGYITSMSMAYYFITSDEKIYKISFYSGAREFYAYKQVSSEIYRQLLEREEVTVISLYPENEA